MQNDEGVRYRTLLLDDFTFSQCKYHVLQIGMPNRDIDQTELDGSDNGTWYSRGSEKQGKGSWKEYICTVRDKTVQMFCDVRMFLE